MKIFSNRQSRGLFAIWVVILILPIFVSCNTEYTGQYFSFPPGSKPHENNWEYTALIVVSSSESPITKKSKKNVKIKVYNRSKVTLLKEEFEFISAAIDAIVVWEKFEDLSVDLLEVGNENAKDSYNKQLLKSGPNRLLEIKYKYESETQKFRR